MHEAVLRDFFSGTATVEVLADDLRGAMVKDGDSVVRHPIVDMTGDFTVVPSHLIALCDAFLAGHVKHDDLSAVGFCLFASEAFCWDSDTPDGARVADVANHWCSPEINFPIDEDHVQKWKTYLDTGGDELRGADA